MREREMSIDIAKALRDEAAKARRVAEHVSNPDDKDVLVRLAASLVEIAERLERDARD
jgi:metal-dependent HD superfamily phosphatase/phosphodiesterase